VIRPWCALLLLALACAPRKDVPPAAAEGNSSAVLGEPVISLERTACFGGCPVYRIWVSADGTVGYEGKAHVRRTGPATGKIPPERVQALLDELDRSGYASLAPSYTSGQSTCGRYSTDSPSAITTVRLQGRTMRVEHDYGCRAAPGTLVVVERTIDEVLNSAQWTGR
jgi:hypothetical protein